jgi:hypothetical protein
MPQLIEHIDQIAHRLERPVLMLGFGHRGGTPTLPNSGPDADYAWETDPIRHDILEWLTAHGISHVPCMPLSMEGWVLHPYEGHVYLEVPDDPAHPDYQMLVAHLEREDGSSRYPGVGIYIFRPDARNA